MRNRGTELNFKDSWRFNVAAYRIDRLLSLGMIPATVERRHNGRSGSFTWWVDDVLMDEQERYRQKRPVPNTNDWNEQMWITRLFDQLIANVDRNLGNLLIDKSYNIWMIDHSRAFRLNKDLLSPQNLSRVDRVVLDRLRQLDPDGLKRAAGDYLNDGEIDALLNRRDRIVAHFDKGGPALVFDRPRALLLDTKGTRDPLKASRITVPASARAARRARSARRRDRRRTAKLIDGPLGSDSGRGSLVACTPFAVSSFMVSVSGLVERQPM